MKKFVAALLTTACAVGFAMPVFAASGSGGDNDAMACTVSVEYLRSGTARLTYNKDFVVGPNSPFSDDFSSATRLRFFDATVTYVDGIPEVSAVFDADVDVFNAVQFGFTLKVRDESNGETQSGYNTFFSSVTGASGSHRSNYTMTCARAQI
ncbi:MAG: hypothetical protein E6Q88_06475 [Lysobacteraceae bacterium]|nr:MAG: hypothetical protein E6Q88_06475 [Xanthomonadaceae bacterium]